MAGNACKGQSACKGCGEFLQGPERLQGPGFLGGFRKAVRRHGRQVRQGLIDPIDAKRARRRAGPSLFRRRTAMTRGRNKVGWPRNQIQTHRVAIAGCSLSAGTVAACGRRTLTLPLEEMPMKMTPSPAPPLPPLPPPCSWPAPPCRPDLRRRRRQVRRRQRLQGPERLQGRHHACKGQNACKGQGFSAMTKEKCDAAKGKYEPGLNRRLTGTGPGVGRASFP